MQLSLMQDLALEQVMTGILQSLRLLYMLQLFPKPLHQPCTQFKYLCKAYTHTRNRVHDTTPQ